ncbi:MAG: plasmid stabilization protein [Actinomycetota bacterium]|nr:plasmid stabilization protein [Actinomycetota bacterium]
MSTLTVRNLDEDLKARLRVRAARHGRSMEAEVREILRESLAGSQQRRVGSRIHARLVGLGLDEIELPPRTELTRQVDFDE